MVYGRTLGTILSGVLLAFAAACGGNGGSDGGSATEKLTSGDFAFEVEFLGAERANGEVRRAGQVVAPPSGTEWWAFELRIKNVSNSSMQSANTPDVGLACGNEQAAAAETLNDPGFIMGRPPYSSAMMGNGASNTGVVPLAVPSGASDCRFVVRMDPLHDPGDPEVVAFPFQTSR